MRTNHLSLIAMSALFFSLILLTVLHEVLRFLVNTTGLDFLNSLNDFLYSLGNFSLPAFISLCGGIVFLAGTRKENPSWYLGIPLCMAFAVMAISPALQGFLVIHSPTPATLEPGRLWFYADKAAFSFLPLCAALFFWSQKQLGRAIPLVIGMMLVISLSSIGSLVHDFFPAVIPAGLHPPHADMTLFLAIYLLIGLPLIGILFLALAAISRYTSVRPAPPESPLPGVQP
jgi:hypothetical protein